MAEDKKKYGVQQRVGERFFKEVDDIKIGRIKNGRSKEKPSMRVVSNLIVRHKNFQQIKEEIIELEEGLLNEE